LNWSVCEENRSWSPLVISETIVLARYVRFFVQKIAVFRWPSSFFFVCDSSSIAFFFKSSFLESGVKLQHSKRNERVNTVSYTWTLETTWKHKNQFRTVISRLWLYE
jgi:hypothetical protein